MNSRRITAVIFCALLIATGAAFADIAFPARLDVIEKEAGVFEITFTLPIVEGRKLRLRRVARPDAEQAEIIAALGFTLPERICADRDVTPKEFTTELPSSK